MSKNIIDIEKLKKEAQNIISPIKPADNNTKADKKFLFNAQRSSHSHKLPEYYLIYFLFSELLKYKNLGQFEKVAWSFPIDFNGKAFLLEHRKFGIGIFIQDKEVDEKAANEIVSLINRAVKRIKPFFDYIAEQAVIDSKLNVTNNSRDLLGRYEYLNQLYKGQFKKYQANKGKYKVKKGKSKFGEYSTHTSLSFKYQQNSNWLAISCIEAFFSWTEHLFIHMAIVGNGVCDGEEIANLIGAEWKIKFKKAIPNTDNETKNFYDELLVVRQQLRNFVAHGAFGKNGNAFSFHSNAGAVPVQMNHKKNKNRFSLFGTLKFQDEIVIELIENFIYYLWNGSLKPLMYFIQEYGLPTILTYSKNGTYKDAMVSFEKMEEFGDYLGNQFDNAANMDW